MTRHLGRSAAALLFAIVSLVAVGQAHAQLSNANVVAACGTPNTTYPSGATRAITQDTTGKLCSSGSGGGGSLSVNASTNPTAVSAGAQPLNESLFSGLFMVPITPAGAQVDLSLPSGILGVNGSAIATVANPFPVQVVATATGGTTAHGLQAAATTNATSVKASAGVVKAMNLFNTTTTTYYLRMYDLAAAPTCSSATGFIRSWPVPAAPAAGQTGGVAVHLPPEGTQYSTGIAYCVTGGPTSTDNTNAAVGVFVNLDYK